jgi:MoaA/NifB/PqqE/SkfB family radical SAM enzyme
MPSEFVSLLENLKLGAPSMFDIEGEEVSTIESLKRLHESYTKKRTEGLIPVYYQKPCGCQLELTYRCNQYCITCYNRSGGERNTWSSLSLAEWKRVAKELADIGLFQCVISGGEPLLLGNDLFEIMDILHAAKVTFIFITNGMLLTREKLDRLSKYQYDRFQVSIDGSRPEIHDHIRGAKSWEKAIASAAMVHEAGIPLVVAHVVLKENLHLVEEMIDLSYFLGANQIVVGAVEISGRAVENYEDIGLSHKEKQNLYERARQKAKEYGKRMEVKLIIDEIMSFRYHTVEGNAVLLIRPNGDVKFDCILPYVLGNVRKQSIREIWETMGYNIYEHPVVEGIISKMKSQEDIFKYLPDIDSKEAYLAKV